MPNYAVVDQNNVVANIIVWDEVSTWTPPEGHIMVKAEEIPCGIGWTHDNGSFIKPEPSTEPTDVTP